MSLSAGTRLGPYAILAPLGAGGMGEVYRARDTRLSRDVAIKVLPAELASDPSRLQRFEKEARLASSLNHPNIVTIYDIGSDHGVSYMAMERVEGTTLRGLLVDGPLPVKRLLQIAVQIAEGLAKAHESGVVHRDLKPENVMVSRDGFVRILDFGLAKLKHAESGEKVSPLATLTGTSPGLVVGTVGYMSPEQASGESVDFRSDQFSFGSILYEMATGKRAFEKKTPVDTLSAILNDEPEPVGSVNTQTPAPLRWTVEQCLAKEPEDRYASTKDLARELARMRDHASDPAWALPPAGRSHARLRIVAALFAGVAALAGVYLLGQRSEARRHASFPSFHRLTFRRGEVHNARIAPDGQTIVYSASWGDDEKQIYSTRIDSPEGRPLGFGRADIVAISSAGEMAIELFPFEVGPGTLARVPLAGGVPREILERLQWASADWSPDGKSLAVVRLTEGGKSRLEFPIGNVILESSGELSGPRISPGGDWIAFVEEGAGLSAVDSSGRGKKVLASGPRNDDGTPCWSADGREIWFNAPDRDRGWLNSLYATDLSGRRRLVTRLPGSDLELFDMTRDGRVLLARHDPVFGLAVVAPGASAERELPWLDGSQLSDLSDDGRVLVMTEVWEGGGPHNSIYLRKTDGSPAVRLGDGRAIAFSPDGKWVLAGLPGGRGSSPTLFLVPTRAGEPRALVSKGFGWIGAATWSPDGSRILFAASETGRRVRLYVLEVAGGEPRAVTPEGVGLNVNAHAISADGKVVLGWSEGESRVSLYPIDGGTPRPVRGLDARDTAIRWSDDGREVYVFRYGKPVTVWLLDPETGERRLWKEIHRPTSSFDSGIRVRIARDGASYAYSWTSNLSALYLVDGLR